jgi:nitroimidazol reductase NimA-like FMN-containing flavoprotein (pyridoxamine 5'-phosphate oxidase superfamily)
VSQRDPPHRPPPVDAGTEGGTLKLMPQDECWTHLRESTVGRLAYVVDGWPVVVPVNYAAGAGEIAFRSESGGKLAAAARGAQVSLQVDVIDPVYRSGWSVLAFGVAEVVVDDDERERLAERGLRSWATVGDGAWIRVRPVRVTGRILPRAWRYPASPD